MHIPDGLLNAPVVATTYTVSAGGLVLVWQKVKKQFDQQTVPAIAMLAAFIFVAQMINIPISGGTSGHLLGGMLAALLVGPYASILILSLVLLVQMLLFQDGGLTALGANILNMGFTGAGGGYLVFSFLNKLNGHSRFSGLFTTITVFLAAWCSVEFGAILCGLELGFSGLAAPQITVSVMSGVHALIGLLEGVMTLLIYESVRMVRPDLIYIIQKPHKAVR